MTLIRCTQALARILGDAVRVVDDAPVVAGGRLRDWTATVVEHRKAKYVLAINAETSLTLVAPLTNDVRRELGAAVRLQLEQLGIPELLVRVEVQGLSAAVFTADETRVASLREVRRHFAHRAGELRRLEGLELRRVQDDLNDLPQAGRPANACMIDDAVRDLYGLARIQGHRFAVQ